MSSSEELLDIVRSRALQSLENIHTRVNNLDTFDSPQKETETLRMLGAIVAIMPIVDGLGLGDHTLVTRIQRKLKIN